MEKQEYLALLTEQIRCKKAHPMIIEEIGQHIEDQAEAYEAAGIPHSKAVAESVRQMGDPIEAGVALDRIHRPKTEWSMIFLTLALTIFGIILQAILFTYADNVLVNETYLGKTILYNLCGVGVMAAVYFLDYSILAKYPLAVYCIYLAGSHLVILNLSTPFIYSAFRYSVITLFIPLFAALIFHFRKKGWKGFLICIFLFLLFTLEACRFPGSIAGIAELIICSLAVMTAAILKGSFGGHKSVKLSLLWGVSVIPPACTILDVLLLNGKYSGLAMYQVDRIKALFSIVQNGVPVGNGILNDLRMLPNQYTLLGNGNIIANSPLRQALLDYSIMGMFSYFGILLSVTVLAVLFLLFAKAFHISIQQKNLLGLFIGIGCSTSFLVKTLLYLASNFGYGILGAHSMPFLSFGFFSTVTNFTMIGLLLSIYRNSTLISEKSCFAKKSYRILRGKNM